MTKLHHGGHVVLRRETVARTVLLTCADGSVMTPANLAEMAGGAGALRNG